jgi:hypothetical protein
MTVGQSMQAAYRAGQQSGDSSKFKEWFKSSGFDGLGIGGRLEREYQRGVWEETSRVRRSAGSLRPPSRKASDDLNRQFLSRQKGATPAKSATYKGRKIEALPDGDFVIPSVDRDSHFDSLKDAKAFLDSWKRNPASMHVLYHNVIQNRDVRAADDVVDNIIRDGFSGRTVWLSNRPVDDGQGRFIGVAVHVPKGFSLAPYRQHGDAIEDFGVKVYEIPAELVNKMTRSHPGFKETELVHLNPGSKCSAFGEFSTRNPEVTDRALRYRANQTPPPGPKQCAFCGSK